MKKIEIGKLQNGDSMKMDLAKLIETRLLIQANSGGGKSYLIRKLLEETHGQVQQIVLDVEGEFSTLREKFGYILAGKGQDIAADPRSASLLARKTLELGVSLIVDLYELKHNDRIQFVKAFLDSLINSPKDLWHDVLIVIDEAHLFAPEKGESQAMGAVIDLATRGRKRGFCAVLATQRLSKLNKDVAAECLNKFIGRTSLDIDRKRASEELGFTSNKDSIALRSLIRGQFHAFGPAISNEVELVNVGKVATTHPERGNRAGHRIAKPSREIESMLSKLSDLPKEAEQEVRDAEAMRARIRDLERLTKQKSDPEAERRAYEKGQNDARKSMASAVKEKETALANIASMAQKMIKLASHEPTHFGPIKIETPRTVIMNNHPPAKIEVEGRTFGQCERKILGFLSARPEETFSKVQIGAMTGYAHSSGGFNNALSNLAQSGLIVRNSGMIRINQEASLSGLIDSDSVPHKLEDWIPKLGACERAIYNLLLSDPEKEWSKSEIAGQAGYSEGSGGFNNSISRLNTLGLLERRSGKLRLNPAILI